MFTITSLAITGNAMQPRNQPPSHVVGRGSQIAPPNRFEAVRTEADWEQLEHDEDLATLDDRCIPTQFIPDQTRSLITHNNSPDIGFSYGINPYRGCEHGCAYCYARPGHETLGMNAGLDFETKVLYKSNAAALLRAELCKPSWRGEFIAISGVTDCYQPAERRLRITRSCIEVLVEARQAFGLISKNALVVRDLDLLAPHAQQRMCAVNISVTTLDAGLCRALEPRTSPPARRLQAIRALSSAGVPVRVMVAPIIPGLTDTEIPAILQAAAEAGASGAGWQMLRLPWAVRPIFEDWLARNRPDQRDRIIARIQAVRGGKMNDYQFGRRMRGQGEYADNISQTLKVFSHKFGLDRGLPPLDTTQFRPPRSPDGQKTLF